MAIAKIPCFMAEHDDSFEVIDDEDQQTPEDKRLREVRLKKNSMRKAEGHRGRALLLSGAIALWITSLLCAAEAWQRLNAGSTAAGVGLITFCVSAAFIGWLCFTGWRRS